MNYKMSDEWKEFFLNSLISYSNEGIEEPDKKHLYYDESILRKIKNFFLKFYYKRDKNRIHCLNGKLYGKDAEKYAAVNDFLDCKGLYYKIFMQKYNEYYQTDFPAAAGMVNPFVHFYTCHYGVNASIVIFENFIYNHAKLPDELPQEYVLDLSMYLLALFSIFMHKNERRQIYLYLKILYPDLFKDMNAATNPDYLKVIDKDKDDNTTRV